MVFIAVEVTQPLENNEGVNFFFLEFSDIRMQTQGSLHLIISLHGFYDYSRASDYRWMALLELREESTWSCILAFAVMDHTIRKWKDFGTPECLSVSTSAFEW